MGKRAFILPALLLTLVLVCATMLTGCGESEYAKNKTSNAALNEAIETLDYCIDGRITAEECVKELKAIVSKYERYEDESVLVFSAVKSISIYASTLSVKEISRQAGSATTAEVMDEIKEARNSLADMLKK